MKGTEPTPSLTATLTISPLAYSFFILQAYPVIFRKVQPGDSDRH
jgi:hypothetical protein